jgi:hypothetical protein
MSKGQVVGFRWLGAAAVVVALGALGWSGCTEWPGIDIEQSNLVSPNGAITQGADEARTNWYPDQPGLDPAIVGGPNFKRLFSTTLPLSAGEKVLAQPLVVNNRVLIATEANNLYLLDEVTGAITAQRNLGGAYNAGAIGCGDITPTVGITGTPVIQASTNTAFVVSKLASGTHQLHAVDATTLAEKAGFPVNLATGITAQNDASKVFNSTYQHQRPGLLLMNGVIYIAFAAHCDIGDYRGWVIGVSTAGAIVARFTTEAGSTGHASGIWMSGAGLMSDGAGQIVYSTGNGMGNPAHAGPIASNAPPGYTEEAVVRTVVQADGSLKATDWFSPFNAHDMGDDDLSGGGVTALPSSFGTAAYPRLAVIVGKAGLFYLLNRDKMGGYRMLNNADDVLTTVNLSGATWGHPAVWPGDGGYVFVTTNGGTGGLGYRLQVLKYGVNGTRPTMTLVGTAQTNGVTDNFGAYSGSPVVTSNGTNAGSAVVWCVGNTAQLRVYKLNGSNLTRIFADSTSSTSKFQTVGVGSGRIYVGTGDGKVLGYGAGTAAVTGAALDFGTVAVGQTKTLTATIRANQNLTIPAGGLTSSNGVYTLGTPTPGLPATLAANATLTVPVTFRPTAAGSVSGSINVAIQGGGGGAIPLTGVGQVNAAQLNITPVTLSFGGVVIGQTKQLTVTIQNTGTQTLNFNAPALPGAPYSATGVPGAGATLAAGASVIATVTFAPTAGGTYNGNLVVNTANGGNATIPLAGTSGTAPRMVVTPLALDFGTIAAGSTKNLSFTIQNTGGTDMTMTISKYPTGAFSNVTILGEGDSIAAGATVTETVRFAPTAAGTFTGAWELTANDGQPRVAVQLTGVATGALTPLPRTGWIASASNTAGDVPANALDGNAATRWSSGAVMAANMWFQVDMGTAQSVSQITMDSAGGDYARGFSVYVTNDPANLGAAVATGTGTGTPVSVSFAAKTGRYIRVVLAAPPAGTGAWWSIQEFNAFSSGGGGTGAAGTGGGTGAAGTSGAAGTGGSGGSALPRTGWVASASNTTGDAPANALDGSAATRWSSGAVMAAGMWFQVDMGAARTVSQIVMDSANGDYARAFSVYVTNDTANLGTAVATGTAAATPVTVPFTAKSGRYIRVVLGTIPAGTTAWWSIQEFNAFGTSGGTGAAGTNGGAGTGGAGTSGSAGTGGGGGAVRINSGGPAVSPYVADINYAGGTTISRTPTIDLSAAINPAPAQVYQSARIGSFTYTVGGFAAGSAHAVRLHFCETYFNTTGSRSFNVTINGTQVLTALDVRATAGAINKALVQQFTVNANATGQYVIQFTTVVNNGMVSGIEIQ